MLRAAQKTVVTDVNVPRRHPYDVSALQVAVVKPYAMFEFGLLSLLHTEVAAGTDGAFVAARMRSLADARLQTCGCGACRVWRA